MSFAITLQRVHDSITSRDVPPPSERGRALCKAEPLIVPCRSRPLESVTTADSRGAAQRGEMTRVEAKAAVKRDARRHRTWRVVGGGVCSSSPRSGRSPPAFNRWRQEEKLDLDLGVYGGLEATVCRALNSKYAVEPREAGALRCSPVGRAAHGGSCRWPDCSAVEQGVENMERQMVEM